MRPGHGTPRVVRRAALLATTLLVAAGAASPAGAQVRASERATLSQVSDGTKLTLDHARPRARGRTAIYGGTVKWGEVWTPGANWATTLEASRDVTIDGHRVPKGKYSVWFVVQPERWTVVLDPRADLYHTEHPPADSVRPGQVRWTVTPTAVPFGDILTWSVPEVRNDGMRLRFHWGDRQLDFDVGVTPTHPLPISADSAAPYLGTYEFRWDGDSTVQRIELRHEGGLMRQRWTPFPDWYPSLQQSPMVRIHDGTFIAAIVRDGKVWEMVADMIFEFTVRDGRAVGFEVRDDRDFLMAKGRRLP